MGPRRLRVAFLVLLILAGPGCTTPVRRAATFEEYFVATCAAWEALLRAVGNPDTGSGSDLSKALDVALAAGDIATADRVLASILREFKTGREQVAVAAGWQPRAAEMALLDRVFVTFEAVRVARVARAAAAQRGESPRPDAVEPAADQDAWFALLDALGRRGASATDRQCANVPVMP
jgi:hypothetical protein